MSENTESKEYTGIFALKGDICYSETPDRLITADQSYVICENGSCMGVFSKLPAEYMGINVVDFGEKLIIPGLVDLHIHAPQYTFRGYGMDLELLDWLDQMAFPEEIKYSSSEYAASSYKIFADDLARSAVTRACIFATIHTDAANILMDLMEKSGLITYVGKVSMDRNAPEQLCEDTKEAIEEVEKWLSELNGKYTRTFPIITPRFVPTCSDRLMEGLGEVRKRSDLPVQSHLSENIKEIEWVSELCPWSEFYGDVYDHFGLFGADGKTIMAHCVWSGDAEIQRMKEQGVYIAHCPESNMNLSSGIAPIRRYLDNGMNIGIGSDVAGGSSPSIFRAMRETVQVSKMYWRLIDDSCKPVTIPEAFYMATMGGGSFFGKVGSFEKGYDFDAVVIDDAAFRNTRNQGIRERIERLIYLDDDLDIFAKFIAGKQTI